MSIINGQPVDAANSNPAWMSRLVDTNTIGKIDLQNSGSSAIVDVQSVINTNITNIAIYF